MIKTRLAAALSLALLVAPVSQAAKYRVVELPVTAEGQSSFPSAINEDGNITVNVKSPYNIPIDLDLLDFESETLISLLTDVQAASNGDFNSVDYEILLALIRTADGAQSAQQIATNISYLTSENETSYIAGFDQLSEPENEFTLSSTTVAKGINNSGFAVGSGEGFNNKIDYTFKLPPTSTDEETSATFVVHEFGTRGFVSRGNTIIELPAPSLIAGGFSEASGINDSNQVVGTGTTLFLNDTIETALTNCESEELVTGGVDEIPATDTTPAIPATHYLPARGNAPVESCISGVVSTFTSSVTSYAQLRGLIWHLDDQGNLLETTELGLLFEPEADDTNNYRSQALGINDKGIAVGISNEQYKIGDNTFVLNFAVLFDGNEVINITPNVDEKAAISLIQARQSTFSVAADINNEDLVVGYQIKRINGVNRTKFFVYDMNLSELTFPEDFFLGSSSVALDINNNGLVVGYADIDASLTGRRSGGFLYNHNTEEFTGVQELISCESPYTIVQANAINDKNEIAATALYQGPSRDSRGEIILDSAGNEVLVDLVTSVKLEPIVGGEIESCEVIDDVNRERQGASLGWVIGFGLLILGFRRFRNRV